MRAGVVEIQVADRNNDRFAIEEVGQVARERAERRTIGIGPAAFGDLSCRLSDRRRRALKEVGRRGRRSLGRAPHDLGDSALDAFEDVGERRQIVERGETAQRLQRAQHVLQRVPRRRAGAHGAGGAIEGARDRGSFPRDERPRARVESRRFDGAQDG